MHVAEEALFSAVGKTHRPTGVQREQAGVNLQADVFAGAERTAHSPEGEPHLLWRQTEAGGDLAAVLVQPLGSDEQFDTGATRIGQCQRGLQAEERLILHSQLVRTFDHHVAHQRLIAGNDSLTADHVAVRVDRRVAAVDGSLGIEEGRQHLVVDDDRGQRSSTGLGMVGCNRSNRFTDVANDIVGEHWLVLADQAIRRPSRNVRGGDNCRHAVDLPRCRQVDAADARMSVRRPQRGTPKEPVGGQVAGKREGTLGFGQAVGPRCAVAETTPDGALASGDAHGWIARQTETR